MDNAVAVFDKDDKGAYKHPWCSVCNHPVEVVEYLTPVKYIESWHGYKQANYTGEILIAVSCHGQSLYFSSWAAEVDKRYFESRKGIQ